MDLSWCCSELCDEDWSESLVLLAPELGPTCDCVSEECPISTSVRDSVGIGVDCGFSCGGSLSKNRFFAVIPSGVDWLHRFLFWVLRIPVIREDEGLLLGESLLIGVDMLIVLWGRYSGGRSTECYVGIC